MNQVSLYPLTISLFSFLILVQVISTLAARLKGQARDSDGRLQPRKGDEFVQGIFNGQVVSLCAVISCFCLENQMVDDFGYKAALPPVFSFGIGLLAYAALVSVYGLVSRLVGFEKNAMVAAYLSHRIIWPRTKLARKKLFAALLVNPFTEELFYRGFLVFYLGNLTGSMGVFLLIGLAACLAIHSYQDIRLLFFHGAVYAVTIGLLFSPVGLLGCFGFHLAGDLYPLTTLEKQRDAWKRFEREKRASRAG